MTRCSDKDNDEQTDDGAEKPSKNQKKRSKGGKHVSFPPDEQIVSGFAEHRNTDRKGKLLFNCVCFIRSSSVQVVRLYVVMSFWWLMDIQMKNSLHFVS